MPLPTLEQSINGVPQKKYLYKLMPIKTNKLFSFFPLQMQALIRTAQARLNCHLTRRQADGVRVDVNMVKTYSSEGELFKSILGQEWDALHPDIQRRFERNPVPGNPIKYTGNLEELSCSRWGKILGLITKPFIKGALIPYTEFNVPVNIQVYTKEGCAYIFKERNYILSKSKPIMFTSYMRLSSKGEVLEYVGMGLGMKLLVFEKDKNLHFKSDGYFWDIGLFRIPIPDILSPGSTYLTHFNEDENQFRIRIDITHKLFGKMFVQAGVFREL